MEPVTIYYCVKSATAIGNLAIAYKKLKNTQNIGLDFNGISDGIGKINFKIECITDYLDIIHSDIQSMMHMYFKSAYENLRYSINAQGYNFYNYIEQAKNRFIDALTVEQNENLILSLLGVAICQSVLGDDLNSKVSLERIKSVSYNFPYICLNDAIPEADLFYRFLWNCIIHRVPASEQITKEEFKAKEFIEKYKYEKDYPVEIKIRKDRAISFLSNLDFYKKLLNEIKRSGGFSKTSIISLSNGDSAPMEKIFKSALKEIQKNDFEDFKTMVIKSFPV